MDINITPLNKTADETTVLCDPSALAEGEQDTLGFECTNGKFVATEIKGAPSGGSGSNAAFGSSDIHSLSTIAFALVTIVVSQML